MVESAREALKGCDYTVEAFADKYDLKIEEAKRLYMRFGPLATNLDLLMMAKKRKETI